MSYQINKTGEEISKFLMGQLVIGLVVLLFGGLIAPLWWFMFPPSPSSTMGDKILRLWFFFLWFAVSWTILICSIVSPAY